MIQILSIVGQSPMFAPKLSVLVAPRLNYIQLQILSRPNTHPYKTISPFLSWKMISEIVR